MKPQHKWEAQWSGHYPCYCHGEWKLLCDGKPVNLDAAGCPFIENNAGTYGEYSAWSFDAGWEETWFTYTSGLGYKKWCKENAHWLHNLNAPYDWREIYKAFRDSDWRRGCCGGCI